MLQITEEQRNILLQYLYSRPYGEVEKGVEMLKMLPSFNPLPETKEE